MKTLPFILLVTLALLSSCSKDENALNNFRVAVDVQGSFDQDNVQVLIDGRERLNNVLTTNHLLGVCDEGQFSVTIPEGNHELTVIVNQLFTKTEAFSVTKKLYIGINFDPQRDAIHFNFSDQPFAYD